MKLKTRDMILVALFAALTAIGAFIRIPIPYVPFTLQYFFCAFSGILLGSKLGAMSQALYVAIGLSGVPVFTNGGGLSYIFQPTFGYLIGFIVGAYVIGKLTEKIKNTNFIKSYISILSGMFFVYLFGLIHLYIIFNFYLLKPKSISWVFFYGCLTVIGGDLVLSAFIAMLSSKILPILRRSSLNPNNN
jgi:biotin transport system substrate-specific component